MSLSLMNGNSTVHTSLGAPEVQPVVVRQDDRACRSVDSLVVVLVPAADGWGSWRAEGGTFFMFPLQTGQGGVEPRILTLSEIYAGHGNLQCMP